jgi:pre-mRNA-processing factor SLU7
MRASGDAAEFEKATRYAWEAQEKKGDTSQHLQANPTAGEFYRKKEREEAERKKAERERELREKYGVDQQTIPAALKDMTVTESETFVEYDEAGLIKGAPKSAARSKYPEDVFTNNHTSVWGSWWSNFQWGYACCHSFIKNSYCTGEEGKLAWEAAERRRAGADLIEEPADELEREEEPVKETKDKKVQARPSGELMDGVSEAELDAYRRKRTDANDPMAKFLGKDELV